MTGTTMTHKADTELARPDQAAVALRTVSPAVDVYTNADAILLLADIPGVAGDDLDVQIDRKTMTIEGRRTLTGVGPEGASSVASVIYRRQFLLPNGIDREHVTAHTDDGVLTVRIPRSEETKPRRISVQAG